MPLLSVLTLRDALQHLLYARINQRTILIHHTTVKKSHQTHVSLLVHSCICNTDGFPEPVSGLFKHPLPNEHLSLLFSFLRVQMPASSSLHHPLGVCRAPLLPCATVPWKSLGL